MLLRSLLVAFVAFVALAAAAACARPPSPSPGSDAAAPSVVSVRVPAALSLARALDSLSVAVDPGSLAVTQVTVNPGMTLGVETHVAVFAQGQPPPQPARHGLTSGTDFALGTSIWNTAQDGLPVPGTKYVAEMQLELFETDVPPGHSWDPHAGRYKALWTRTLRQAEE